MALRTSRAGGYSIARGYSHEPVLAIGGARTYNTDAGTGTVFVKRIARTVAAGEHAA